MYMRTHVYVALHYTLTYNTPLLINFEKINKLKERKQATQWFITSNLPVLLSALAKFKRGSRVLGLSQAKLVSHSQRNILREHLRIREQKLRWCRYLSRYMPQITATEIKVTCKLHECQSRHTAMARWDGRSSWRGRYGLLHRQ